MPLQAGKALWPRFYCTVKRAFIGIPYPFRVESELVLICVVLQDAGEGRVGRRGKGEAEREREIMLHSQFHRSLWKSGTLGPALRRAEVELPGWTPPSALFPLCSPTPVSWAEAAAPSKMSHQLWQHDLLYKWCCRLGKGKRPGAECEPQCPSSMAQKSAMSYTYKRTA